MTDTAWSVPAEHQHRVSALHTANPWVTNRLWGRKLTGEHSGHASWLGWVGKPERRTVPESDPTELSEETSIYSTALDQLTFQYMLMSGGMSTSGERVLSEASVSAMTTDQLDQNLSDGDFNSHSQVRTQTIPATARLSGMLLSDHLRFIACDYRTRRTPPALSRPCSESRPRARVLAMA